MSLRSGPFLLAVLDGLALNPESRGNAVTNAKKPTLDRLFKDCPWTTLTTFGERVGLPDDQMGNSEVGHLNIGAGRVVEQELTRINRAVKHGELLENKEFAELICAAKGEPSRALQIVGLVSRGGVHSSLEHIVAIVRAAAEAGVKHIFVHAITDGRDRPPDAAVQEIGEFSSELTKIRTAFPDADIRLASIIGRYFVMDRDNRWDRTKKAYELMVAGSGRPASDAITGIKDEHARGITDEFLEPIKLLAGNDLRSSSITDGDALLFANFRADRMRQIARALFSPQGKFNDFDRSTVRKLSYLASMTQYEDDFPLKVLFSPFSIVESFGEIVAEAGLHQLRIAETEKYPHVTYFFNGGREEPFRGEERILVPSPRDVPTYDHKPQMSAPAVTDALIAKLNEKKTDVFILNYANCDMVGHTGSYAAAVEAVETVDGCLGRVLEVLKAQNGLAFITADHGNADQMIDYETGAPHTFHTKYPVPFIVCGAPAGTTLRDGGALCDIAPTACELLGLKQPKSMTGRSLVNRG